MTNAINITTNTTAIADLLKLEGKVNTNQVFYKKTAKAFKKSHSIELENAPLIFSKHGHIWKLSHVTCRHKGRTIEAAEYLPFANCGDKFLRLENQNIKTCWDNISK